MKTSVSVLLSLPVLFSSPVTAIPSPTFAEHQQPLQVTHSTSPLSQWRTLSNHLIGAIFGFSSESASGRQAHTPPTTSKIDRPPASHTLAQYGGDLVLRFNISTSEEAASLAEAADTLLLDVWEFSHDWVDIRLAKDIVPSLLGLLPATLQTSHTPLMREQDLVQAIHNTYPTPRGHDQPPLPQRHHPATPATPPSPNRGFSPSLEQATGAETNIFFSDYQPLSVIEPWLRLLSSLFTTHVRLVNLGLSYEGRRIPAVRVGVHPTNNEDPDPPKRKTILVVGGAHAREWIGTTTVNYIAYSLITGYGKLQSITKLLQDFDFVFIPTLNPDGYVYTWETDRLWRKNRQQTSVRFCHGIDLDHAFGFAWEASGNACSESYAGESAFEAVEARRLADWARNETQNNNVEFVGFLDLHSYSQEILYPYSYSCGATPPGLENLEELAAGLSKAIRISHGHNYEILPACEGNVVPAAAAKKEAKADKAAGKEHLRPRLEASGGSLLDYFYGVLDVRYAYQLKLRDRGTYGFLLPKENIVPTGKEVLNAVLYLTAFLSDMYSEDAAEVRLTRPVWDDADVPFAPAAEVEDEAVDEDLQGEDDAEGNDNAEEEVVVQVPWAPTEDILDEVEEESISGWMFAQPVLDAADVQWDLKRRRRR